jgi:hypothetical protein
MLKIFSNKQINNLIVKEKAIKINNIKKEFKNKDVQKAFISDLKNSVKYNTKKPFNLFLLNQLKDFKMFNVGVEINEDVFFRQLEVLPPIYLKNKDNFSINGKKCINGFFVSEPVTYSDKGTIFNGCVQTEGNKYFCVISSIKGWV